MIKASIVVLSFNQLEETTKPCLESIIRNTAPGAYELIVVDNASTDATENYLQQFLLKHPKTTLKINSSNKGYARGNNDGISLATGDSVILLNSDTLVPPHWLENLLEPFERDPKLGLVGPISNSVGNEQKVNLPGLIEENFEIVSEKYCTRHREVLQYVKRLGFFCVALKRQLLEDIGLLDDRFGIGMFEDDDYCLRVLNAGHKIAFTEGCFVYHKGSLSFNKLGTDNYRQLFEKNKYLFQEKHNTGWYYNQILSYYLDFFDSNLKLYQNETRDLHPALERILVRLEDMRNAQYLLDNLERTVWRKKNMQQVDSNAQFKSKNIWRMRWNNFYSNFIHGNYASRYKFLKSKISFFLNR